MIESNMFEYGNAASWQRRQRKRQLRAMPPAGTAACGQCRLRAVPPAGNTACGQRRNAACTQRRQKCLTVTRPFLLIPDSACKLPCGRQILLFITSTRFFHSSLNKTAAPQHNKICLLFFSRSVTETPTEFPSQDIFA
jgi:hypothetical protein